MRPALALLLALSVATAAPLPFPNARHPPDLRAMQGEWQVARPSLGRAAPDDYDLTLKVSGNRMTFTGGGEMKTTWAVTLDPSKRPKAMDLRLVASKLNLSPLPTLLGVYRIEGDTFTFAYGNERPNHLEVNNSGGFLYVCRRKK
jgi:uncharacterized protein (TIGR03067 family)